MKRFLAYLCLVLGFGLMFNVNAKAGLFKKKDPIKIEDVKALGDPKIITNLPTSMKNKLKCEKHKVPKKIMSCYGKKAPQLMSKAFGHTKKYTEKHSDVMIKGMAWFDLFYSTQLWKNRKYIKRYRDNNNGKSSSGLKKMYDEKVIRSLISTNKGRKSMREALGMSLDLDTETAIKRFWALGELLGLGEAKKNDISEDMLERRKIMAKYTDILGKIEKKLENDKNKSEDIKD